jgi:hypothetical protein
MPTKYYPFSLLYIVPGAKNGLLIRGGDVLERLSGIDVVVFDKVILHCTLHSFNYFYVSFPFNHRKSFKLSVM